MFATAARADHNIHLVGGTVELLIDTSAGYPIIAHWGAPVSRGNSLDLPALLSGPVPHAHLDRPADAGALRDPGRGFHGRPAVRGHRGSRAWSTLFELRSIESTDTDCQFQLVDAAAMLSLSLRYEVLPEGVIKVDVQLTNDGDDAYTLDELSSWLPLPDRAAEIIDFSGRWLRERQLARRPILPGIALREGQEGRSGHDYTIVQCASTAGATFARGEIWAMALMWSGNTRHMVEQLPTGRKSIGAGELLAPGEVVLGPGERYTAPTVVALHSRAGLDGISDVAHGWLRSRPQHPTRVRPRPLTLNVWEAVYFDHDLERLSALAEVAASVGVERFVLDDGWFGARRDDHAGLGDWVVSPDVWPDGLRPLADRIRSLGMEFGLWFEGEMVSPDSELYRTHPDWILRVDSRIPPTARNQLVLDLSNTDAYAHVLEQVDAVIRDAGVSYIKWDHNRTLVDPGHGGAPAVRRQTQAIYALFDELRRRNPGLEIESCASGGGRVDLGMVMHADRFWTSDSNDPLERQEIQRWTSLVIPPELLGMHIGPTISHTTGRRHSIQFRAITALFGHAGIEWNLLEATDDERAAIRDWAVFYRAERDLLHSGRVVRGDHGDPAALVHGVVARDRSRAIFAYVQKSPAQGSVPDTFVLPGLDPDAVYRVSSRDFGGAPAVQHRPPRWMAGAELTGAALGEIGLRPPIVFPEEAILVVCDRIPG
ncbi:alpha-galactosidase [Agromyces sp. Soil535]|uniref:alpha-galactosidase n=1 Tax=Agromyces sp. Soil535 TaxID=1736390 RepID=UPI0006F80550|nr:alpha-galactosidase [Agromyces sp. Soil535]KRE31020.1 hypothetical protein ASG80_00520 [Agromyces sp. Soil535]